MKHGTEICRNLYAPNISSLFLCHSTRYSHPFSKLLLEFQLPEIYLLLAMKRIRKTRSGLTENWYNKTSSFMKNIIIFSFNSINSYLLLRFWVMILFMLFHRQSHKLWNNTLLMIKKKKEAIIIFTTISFFKLQWTLEFHCSDATEICHFWCKPTRANITMLQRYKCLRVRIFISRKLI